MKVFVSQVDGSAAPDLSVWKQANRRLVIWTPGLVANTQAGPCWKQARCRSIPQPEKTTPASKPLPALTEHGPDRLADHMPVVLDWLYGCCNTQREPTPEVMTHLYLATDAPLLFGGSIAATAFGDAQSWSALPIGGIAVNNVMALGGIARNALMTQARGDVLDGRGNCCL